MEKRCPGDPSPPPHESPSPPGSRQLFVHFFINGRWEIAKLSRGCIETLATGKLGWQDRVILGGGTFPHVNTLVRQGGITRDTVCSMFRRTVLLWYGSPRTTLFMWTLGKCDLGRNVTRVPGTSFLCIKRALRKYTPSTDSGDSKTESRLVSWTGAMFCSFERYMKKWNVNIDN